MPIDQGDARGDSATLGLKRCTDFGANLSIP
jgi:hypothetical protein